MDESYETFEEELGPTRADPPPQKPVRQIHRPAQTNNEWCICSIDFGTVACFVCKLEMYAPRKTREEMASVSRQPRAEIKTLPREPSFPRTTSLQKALSIQNLTQIETPWENVTLNRCLFVAITILVLTSGLQKLHETLRGQGTIEEEEEDVGLVMRRSGTLRHRGQLLEPETSLWEVMFWWLPDFDDEEDDDDDEDDGEVKRGRSKKGAMARTSRGLRNKPAPKNLMKQKDGKLKDRTAKKKRADETKDKKERDKKKDLVEEADEDEGDRDTTPKESIKMEDKKEKKKSQKG